MPNIEGREPVIEFRLMSIYASSERRYKDDEIVPLSELSLSFIRVREVTKLIAVGIDPIRPKPLKSILVTPPLASQAIPPHEHSGCLGVGGDEPVHVHPD